MAKFITKIQLQDAGGRDHDALYKELEIESFKNEKHNSKIKPYVAGNEVFTLKGDLTLQNINAAVFRAYYKTGKSYFFFVMRYKNAFYPNQ